jgi:hypothetical protein
MGCYKVQQETGNVHLNGLVIHCGSMADGQHAWAAAVCCLAQWWSLLVDV